MKRQNRRTLVGKTDEAGRTSLYHTHDEENVKVFIDSDEKLFRDKLVETDLNDWFNEKDI